jgi:NADPH:quinone reductase-like Zn-dependent oxidoreductase
MTIREARAASVAPTMRAVRLGEPGRIENLTVEEIATPTLGHGEVLVRVHAAAITRDEWEWPVDRLPATPSYELSGVVAVVAPGVDSVAVGDPVFALTSFDRDGAAADYVVVPAELLAPKPRSLDHVSSAAIPLAALSAWQGLFDHGRLEGRQRALILGAAGGVGHLATQLARWRGAHVIGSASSTSGEAAREYGAHEVVDGSVTSLEGTLETVDLVFDTVGGEALERSTEIVREGGRLVSVAEEPPKIAAGRKIATSYFVVEPNREQLVEITRLADEGELRPAIDSVFSLADVRSAFQRTLEGGKRGKVVLRVEEGTTE